MILKAMLKHPPKEIYSTPDVSEHQGCNLIRIETCFVIVFTILKKVFSRRSYNKPSIP
jgi:hypothetical protein